MLDLLVGGRDWRRLAADLEFPRSDPAADHAPREAFVLQHDTRVVGRLAVRLGRLTGDLGRHAWSSIEAAPAQAPEGASGRTLWVEDFGWRGLEPGAEAVSTWVRIGLVARCRRLGADRVVCPVPVPRRGRRPEALPASAYLQQVQYRGLEAPPTFQPLFAADFELRGFWAEERVSSRPAAALVWEGLRT